MKMYSKFFGILFLLILNSCGSEEVITTPASASFEIQQSEYFVDEQISFSNTSSGVDSNSVFEWSFGDGNTSTDKNPTHTYTDIGEGIYSIKLKISNSGTENSFTKEISIAYSVNISGRKPLTEKLADTKILTCAHRGYHKNAPENSLQSQFLLFLK